MTIDEAILFCDWKSKNIKLKTDPDTFVQIATWLRELKELREMVKCKAFSDGYKRGQIDMLSPYDAESIEDLVENAYKKGKADANAKIGPTIKDIHDGVYEEGQRHGKEELLRRLDNCRFGERGGLLNWSDVLKCFEVEE